MAFGASIKGWRHCRPVISVDATFLTSHFRGVLFIASTKDADNHIFPLGFGVGDSENNSSWHWFFKRLRSAIGVRSDLVIISDRHPGILNAVPLVYPEAEHVYCMYHLLKNLKTHVKFLGNDELFEKCAKAYTKSDFDDFMRQMIDIRPEVHKYLSEDIGYARWARCYATKRRYNTMTSNISESMNSTLSQARSLPGISVFVYGI